MPSAIREGDRGDFGLLNRRFIDLKGTEGLCSYLVMKEGAGEVPRSLDRALDWLGRADLGRPRIGVVLGSGYGELSEHVQEAARIDPADIPGYPTPRAPGHAGELVFGTMAGAPVCVQSGRKHVYENEGIGAVVFGVLCLARLGTEAVILTNAAGTAHAAWSIGDLMLIRDHLDGSFHAFTSGIPSLLKECGFSVPEDLSGFYSARLMRAVRRAAERAEIEIREGVYCFTPGPFFETAAEVRGLRALGVDAFGMSTAAEAIAAALTGMEVAALSGITNYATGIAAHPHTHAFVTESAGRIVPRMSRLLTEVLKEVSDEHR